MKKGVSYICVTWEGEGVEGVERKYHGEVEFYNYDEAYRFCQDRLKSMAKEEYMMDCKDPDDYYYAAHYFLCMELYKMTEKIDVFEQKRWDKEIVLYFYWSGRRVIYSSGKGRKFTFERIAAIFNYCLGDF